MLKRFHFVSSLPLHDSDVCGACFGYCTPREPIEAWPSPARGSSPQHDVLFSDDIRDSSPTIIISEKDTFFPPNFSIIKFRHRISSSLGENEEKFLGIFPFPSISRRLIEPTSLACTERQSRRDSIYLKKINFAGNSHIELRQLRERARGKETDELWRRFFHSIRFSDL